MNEAAPKAGDEKAVDPHREELVAQLAPQGVSFGYYNTAGTWIETPTHTLEQVSTSFTKDPIPEYAKPLVCTPGRWHPELFGTLILEDGFHFQCHGVVDVPGYHILYTKDGHRRFVIAAPEQLKVPKRTWGWQIQLYATRSRNSWGIGDFRDLGLICRLAAQQGATCVQVSPVHAIAPTPWPQPSPYSPASRLFLNLLHVAPGAIEGAERVNLSDLDRAGRALNQQRLIDRDTIWALKREALERVWAAVKDEPNVEFRTWETEQGNNLHRFAVWSAIAESLQDPDWHRWPVELRRPESRGVAEFAERHADRVRFHTWAQWVANVQYRDACASGVDVVADLAVGFDASSADAWAFQDLLEFDFEIGAPPDSHNTEGQRWGLPPFNPNKLIRADFEPFIEMVRSALRNAGSLRMDHVMQLWRLYWVPVAGGAADGVYVYYPVDALLAILRLEAMRGDAWIVGEDMGTVAAGVRETMADIGMLGNRSAMRTNVADFPLIGVGTSSTHDQVTVAGLLTGGDVADLKRIGKNADWAQINRVRRELAELAHIDPDKPESLIDAEDIKAAVLARYRLLSDAESVVVVINIDDAAMVAERPNMPGTIDAYPNWKIALPKPVSDILTSDLTTDLVNMMHEDRLAQLNSRGCQMRVYLIRHGQTDSNLARILDSHYPGPSLNATGFAQADELAGRMVGRGIGAVYSSDITRAVQTGAAMAERLGVAHTILPGLREIACGDQEGSADFKPFIQMVQSWRQDLSVGRPGGETGFNFFHRYDQAFHAMFTSGFDTVAAISHSGAMRTWLSGRVRDIELAKMASRPLANVQAVLLENTGNGWKLLDWGESEVSAPDHLRF